VSREVVAAGKGAVASLADIRAGAGVLAQVACELIGARKLPVAALPGACKGPLACVSARMCLEMRALGVALVAAVVRAGVRPVLGANGRAALA